MRAMKDTGVDWIGKIPSDWHVRKLRGLLKQVGSGTTPKGDDYYTDGIHKWLNTGDLNDGYITDIPKSINAAALLDHSVLRQYPADSIVIAMYGATIGKLGILKESCVTNQACCVMFAWEELLDNKFLYYYLYAIRDAIISLSYGAGQPNISQETIKRLKVPICRAEEQHKISRFLDAKCAQIDAIIEKQQQVIEKLKAYKQSVITEAVTKGLDPTVPMKDSGVEWIGKVPIKREIVRLKYLVRLIESGVSVNAGQEEAKDGEYGVLKTSCVSKYEFDIHENKSVNYDEMDQVSCPVRGNTIIVSRMNTPELVGACGYVAEDNDVVFLPDRLWQVHFLKGINVRYIWYFLISSNIRSYYESLSTGTSSSMQNISQGQFGNAFVALPELDEQNSVVKHLDSCCAAIDSLTEKKKTIIDKLTDYKKSLIYEAVTGKMEV